MSIPKKIHYCWFGGKPLDSLALRCIESWKKHFPDYEIIKWDESNFDISSVKFMQEAYNDKKWAFVSDVARLLIIYEHGGIYFDTDVEVVASFDDILNCAVDGFMGVEATNAVATGLGFAAIKEAPIVKELLDIYKNIDYCDYRENLSAIACPIITTEYLRKFGYEPSNHVQQIQNFDIYPTEYFAPLDYYTAKLHKTRHTHSIHWYGASWLSKQQKDDLHKSQMLSAIIGKVAADNILGIQSCIKKEGIWKYLHKRIHKFIKIK